MTSQHNQALGTQYVRPPQKACKHALVIRSMNRVKLRNSLTAESKYRQREEFGSDLAYIRAGLIKARKRRA